MAVMYGECYNAHPTSCSQWVCYTSWCAVTQSSMLGLLLSLPSELKWIASHLWGGREGGSFELTGGCERPTSSKRIVVWSDILLFDGPSISY